MLSLMTTDKIHTEAQKPSLIIRTWTMEINIEGINNIYFFNLKLRELNKTALYLYYKIPVNTI